MAVRHVRSGMVAILPLLLVATGCDSGEVAPDSTNLGTGDVSVSRGKYLVEGPLQCFICHSERDWQTPGGPPIAGRAGAGHIRSDDGQYRLVAPNLTPDPETGTGRWTDDRLARAIREGVGHDGRRLSPRMW